MSLFKKYYETIENSLSQNQKNSQIFSGSFITVSKKQNLEIKNYNQSNKLKPSGLWFCRGKEWIDFLLDYEYIDEEGNPGSTLSGSDFFYKYVIKFKMNKEIYTINNDNDLLKFYQDYSNIESKKNTLEEYEGSIIFKWQELSKKYDGIYIKDVSKRKNVFISTWDVPSGCLWNLSGIKQEATITIPEYMKFYYKKDPSMKKIKY